MDQSFAVAKDNTTKAATQAGISKMQIYDRYLLASPLGRATRASGLLPQQAIDLLPSLAAARANMTISGNLHKNNRLFPFSLQ